MSQPDDDPKWLLFKNFFDNLLNAGADKVFWHQAPCSTWGPGFIENGSELPASLRDLLHWRLFFAQNKLGEEYF